MVFGKEVHISEIEAAKKQYEHKYAKAKNKLIGKTLLCGTKDILRDQSSIEITKD